jgi:DNA-binding transcriptional LysR family regulator
VYDHDSVAAISDFEDQRNIFVSPSTWYECAMAAKGSLARQAPSKAMDWDGVRVFLAVARHGSLRAAGRALGLSQPTIARRLAEFEATFGGPTLFDRLPEGAQLNAAGERLVAEAERVEQAMLTLERRRVASSSVLSGTVRISDGECASGFLARCLSGATTTPLPPGITLEFISTPANLVRREADLALRHQPPESGDYYAAKLGTFAVAVYRRRGSDSGWPIPKSSRRGGRTNQRAGCSDRWNRRKAP